MAVRQIEPIDRAELRATIQKWIDAHTDVDDTDGVGLLEDVLWEINAQPTLTPPNEALTWEKLENMKDTTPVWWDQINSWVLVYKGNLTTWSGKHLYAKGSNGKFYRRPPEGEEGDADRG